MSIVSRQLSTVSISLSNITFVRDHFNHLLKLSFPQASEAKFWDPAVSEPAVSEPAASEPAVSEAAASEAAASEPREQQVKTRNPFYPRFIID